MVMATFPDARCVKRAGWSRVSIFSFFFCVPNYISGVHHFWVRFLRMSPVFCVCVCVCFVLFVCLFVCWLFFCVFFPIRPLGYSHSVFVDAGYVFVAGIHPSRTGVSGSFAMECMCAQTRPRFILSSERVLGEWNKKPC